MILGSKRPVVSLTRIYERSERRSRVEWAVHHADEWERTRGTHLTRRKIKRR